MTAIIFDLDDTLLIEEAAAKSAMLETCEYAKQVCHIESVYLLNTLKTTCREFWHESPAREYCLKIGISSWEGLWSRFLGENDELKKLREWSSRYQFNSWNQALLQHGVNDSKLANELMDLFHENRRKRHDPFSDAIPALNELVKLCTTRALSVDSWDILRDLVVGVPDQRLRSNRESCALPNKCINTDFYRAASVATLPALCDKSRLCWC